mmetsp:Transcript_32796/g.50068  ORF Transcript_32796/g.50068 Transcript_32796/m.50068 type:complete len:103 (+) Transcript_32796:1091-1399(+)
MPETDLSKVSDQESSISNGGVGGRWNVCLMRDKEIAGTSEMKVGDLLFALYNARGKGNATFYDYLLKVAKKYNKEIKTASAQVLPLQDVTDQISGLPEDKDK